MTTPKPSLPTAEPGDVEQRAREMWAAEWTHHPSFAHAVLCVPLEQLGPDDQKAIRAITKALLSDGKGATRLRGQPAGQAPPEAASASSPSGDHQAQGSGR